MRRLVTILAVSAVAVLCFGGLGGATVGAARPTAVNGTIAYPCLIQWANGSWRPGLCVAWLKYYGPDIIEITQGLPPETQPAWSPDGTRLAYVANGRISIKGIFGVPCLGCWSWIGRVRHLTAGGSDSEPAWSPDGKQIAFVSRAGGNADVYVARARGGAPRQLTRSGQDDLHPTWAPSSRQIAFSRNGSLFVVDVQGGAERRLGAGLNPDWSPNGRQLAFELDGDIWIARSNGSARANVTRSSDVRETAPKWSPDGKKLAFPGLPAGESAYDLYILRLGTAPRRVRLGGDRQRPIVSPSLDWQPLSQIVMTVDRKRPVVSLRDPAGRKLTTIRAGFYTFGEIDRSRRHGICVSFGECHPLPAKHLERRFSPSDPEGLMLKPGVHRYWCPFHPKAERGTIRAVDDP